MNKELQDKFIHDISEMIEALEEDILRIEEDFSNKEIINEIFRTLHNIKGNASMFGFNLIGEITHDLESIFYDIREGSRNIDKTIIDLTLRTIDVIKILVQTREKLDVGQEVDYNMLLLDIKAQYEGKNTPSPSESSSSKKEIGVQSKAKGYYIHFTPDKQVLARGIRPYELFIDLKELGAFVTNPEIPENLEVDYNFNEEFNASWEIFLVTEKELNDIQACFIFYWEQEVSIVPVADTEFENNPEFAEKYAINNPSDSEYTIAINAFEKLGLSKQVVPQVTVESENDSNTLTSAKEIVSSISSIKVSTDKLDRLINLIGELIIVNSRLTYLVKDASNLNVRKTLNSIERLSKDLRDDTLQLRLVKIDVLSTRLKRLVRDLSGKLNKEVEFVGEGTETELDSNIINNLESPLIHLIRNCVDHGIESPEERLKSNKPAKGIVRLFAYYSGSNVFIQVQDDGKGIDPEQIRQKAIAKGYITSTAKLSDREIYELIFLPGFSTAQNMTDVSGRGVGMDVVKKKVNELRGEIEVDSEIGLGTSFTIKLPLTLSIIDTLKVDVGGNTYLIPLNYVDSCHKKTYSELFQGKNKTLSYKGEIIPFIFLKDEFDVEGNNLPVYNIVILKVNEKNYALVVDSVLGEHQAVLKPINSIDSMDNFFTGASVLGNGQLALILDINHIINIMKSNEVITN